MTYSMADYAYLSAIREVDGGYEADTLPTWMETMSGAQLMFQQVFVAEKVSPGKRLLSLHTMFANGGRSGEPVSIEIETMQAGRSFSSLAITMRQQHLVISRALALMTADEDDYIRHQVPAPVTTDWSDWPDEDPSWWPGWVRQAADSSANSVRLRFGVDEPTDDPTWARALAAVATEQGGVLSGLQMLTGREAIKGKRPASVILTHVVNFLEPITGQDLVLTSTPSYAGRGRANGFGEVNDDQGKLLATFATTGFLRAPR